MPSRQRRTTEFLPRSGGRDDEALEQIWLVVAALPRGQVTTYGEVAAAAGLPGRARLVGRALKVSDESMHLPWHRVVGAGGRIVFPPRSRAHREQAQRLRAEGLVVLRGRVSLKPTSTAPGRGVA
jgi:methylated-DNA-protein-cysteine methyltransferase related protein